MASGTVPKQSIRRGGALGRVLLALTLTAAGALGQTEPAESCGCDAFIIPSVATHLGDDVTRLASLRVLDEAAYDRLQLKLAAGWSGGLIADQLALEGGYAAFDRARTSELDAAAFPHDLVSSRSLLLMAVPPEAVTAWATCRLRCLRTTVGVHATIVAVDRETVRIAYRWLAPEGGDGVGFVTFSEVDGGNRRNAEILVGIVPNGTEIPRDTAREITFYRHEGKTFRAKLVVNNKYGGTISVPWVDLPERGPVDPRKAPVRLAQLDFTQLSLHTCEHCREPGGARFNMSAFARAETDTGHEPRASTGDLSREFVALQNTTSEHSYPLDLTLLVDLHPNDIGLEITGALFSSSEAYVTAPPTEFKIELRQRSGRWRAPSHPQVRQLLGKQDGRTRWRASLDYEVHYIAY